MCIKIALPRPDVLARLLFALLYNTKLLIVVTPTLNTEFTKIGKVPTYGPSQLPDQN
jgi:hypothetical protein